MEALLVGGNAEVLSTLSAEPTCASFPVSLTTTDTSLVEEEQPEAESRKRSRRSNPNSRYARDVAFIRQERGYLDDEGIESFFHSKPNK